MQDRCREPRFSSAFDLLLQLLLLPVQLRSFTVSQCFRQKPETTARCLHFAHPFVIAEFVYTICKIVGQIDVALDCLSITLPAHKLHCHPKLESVESARTHLPVTKEVKLNISAAAILTQVFRSDIKRFAQDTAAISH